MDGGSLGATLRDPFARRLGEGHMRSGGDVEVAHVATRLITQSDADQHRERVDIVVRHAVDVPPLVVLPLVREVECNLARVDRPARADQRCDCPAQTRRGEQCTEHLARLRAVRQLARLLGPVGAEGASVQANVDGTPRSGHDIVAHSVGQREEAVPREHRLLLWCEVDGSRHSSGRRCRFGVSSRVCTGHRNRDGNGSRARTPAPALHGGEEAKRQELR
mmetsp:Transcript_71812/g.196708  ORF Transcript_71812/g.196708 Transcript_71812/m.196708 type:complete len:220 (-) Transcript_71812:416-1075(-)